jgi:hypothetical protein
MREQARERRASSPPLPPPETAPNRHGLSRDWRAPTSRSEQGRTMRAPGQQRRTLVDANGRGPTRAQLLATARWRRRVCSLCNAPTMRLYSITAIVEAADDADADGVAEAIAKAICPPPPEVDHGPRGWITMQHDAPARAPKPPPHPAPTRIRPAAPASSLGRQLGSGTPTAALPSDPFVAAGSAGPAGTSHSPFRRGNKVIVISARRTSNSRGRKRAARTGSATGSLGSLCTRARGGREIDRGSTGRRGSKPAGARGDATRSLSLRVDQSIYCRIA